jgi:hypothetical protein
VTSRRPLSVGQQAMWFIHRLAPGSAAYNVTLGMRVHSTLDAARLAQAVAAVEERQDALRTTYVEVDGQPWRVVQPAGDGGSPRLQVREVPGVTDDRLLELAHLSSTAPFALATGDRPFRVVLLRRAPSDAILVVAVHHIAADAPSLFLILRDLLDAYQAVGEGRSPALSPLRQTYDDYVSREQRLLASPRAARMAGLWAAACAGSTAAQLPADRPPPDRSNYAGDTWKMRAAPGFAGRLRAASSATHVTPFAYLLGAFQATLRRYTGQDDFLIGTSVALRLNPGLRDVVGYMVNSLPLRARFTARTTLAETVAAASDQIRKGVAQAGYPYPLMDAAQAPLFRITCTMLAVDQMAVPLPAEHAGLLLSFVDIPQQEGQFDLSVELRYSSDSLTGVFRYDTDVFERATIEGLAERFTRFAELAISQSRSRVADLPLVDETELDRLLAFGGIS